jgi:acyl dehydratase
MSGRYFEEWQIGDRIDHPIHRTVTETDNLLFSAMTHNPNPCILTPRRRGSVNLARFWSMALSPSP